MRIRYKDYILLHPNIKLKDARGGKYPCFYCGVPSQSIDHFIPQVHAKTASLYAETMNYTKEHLEWILLNQKFIPSCRECNSLLSTDVFDNPDAKKKYLKQKLSRRYKKLLASPDWTNDEIDELDYRLRLTVLAGIHDKNVVKQRIVW